MPAFSNCDEQWIRVTQIVISYVFLQPRRKQGKANTAMQSFKQLGNADLAAVITYERNSWGNKGGEVQPAEVAARRK